MSPSLSRFESMHFTIVLVELIPNCCHVLSKRFGYPRVLKHKPAISTSPTVKFVVFFPNQKWHGTVPFPQAEFRTIVPVAKRLYDLFQVVRNQWGRTHG
jgi:hypothetical protein